MQAYYLIASYRYSYRLNNQIYYVYKNQVVIPKIENNKLSSLPEIDKFTSRNTKQAILDMIKEEYGNIGYINHLSIKYMKNLSSNPYYFDVVCGDESFYNCINVSNNNTVRLENKTTLAVNTNSKLFVDEMRNFENMLTDEKKTDKEKCEEIKKMIPKRKNGESSDLECLVDKYFNTPIGDRGYVLGEIRLEFSRYKTFRGWIIEQKERIKGNYIKRTSNSIGQDRKMSSNKVKNEPILSIDENISLYEKNFKEEHGISYDEYAVLRFNEENEEFLDEEDYREMFDYENSKIVRRRR